MPPKRKPATKHTPKSTKQKQDASETTMPANTLIPTPSSPSSPSLLSTARPISAIAARRALALAEPVLANSSKDTDTEMDDGDEVTDWDKNAEGLGDLEEEEEEEEEEDMEANDERRNRGGGRTGRNEGGKADGRNRFTYVDPSATSKFAPTAGNVARTTIKDNEDICVFGLRHGETLVFQGHVLVSPLYGAFTLMGHTFHSTTIPSPTPTLPATLTFHPVFSPRTHALALLKPVSSPRPPSPIPFTDATPITSSLHKTLTTLLAPLQSSMRHFEAIVLVRSMTWCGIEGIEKVAPLFKGIFSAEVTPAAQVLVEGGAKGVEEAAEEAEEARRMRAEMVRVRGFYPIFEPTPGVKAFEVPETWSDGVDSLMSHFADPTKSPAVAVVCGSKKMGKSTFARYLLNSMLNVHRRVAFIEADIGQSEFSPQGMVSLHVIARPVLGPPFTHPHQVPHRSFFVGATSPRDDPDYYLECLKELIEVWRAEFMVEVDGSDGEEEQQGEDVGRSNAVPLVVNTHGWIKGLGYDLLLHLLSHTRPTHIFAFYSITILSRNLPPTFAATVSTLAPHSIFSRPASPPLLHHLTSPVESRLSQKYHPSDHRTLTLLSYLHHDPTVYGRNDTAWWDFDTRLVERVPWCLDWTKGLRGVWVLFEEVRWSQLLYALNGSLVALVEDLEEGVVDDRIVEVNDERQGGPQVTPPRYFPTPIFPPPPPSLTTCHGLALVRAIDPARHAFHLLTPISFDTLRRVNALVKGNIELPIWAMLDDRRGGGGGVCGVPWKHVPYVSFEAGEGVGSQARRVRRNVMRRGQVG